MSASDLAIAVLQQARDTFQRYGDNHTAKQPPQPEKAGVNYEMVAKINQVLLMLAVEESETVGLSDTFVDVPVPPPQHPAKERLKVYLATLDGRADDSWTQYSALVGDFRALTKDS